MASTALIPKEELTKKQVKEEEEEEANVLCWELGSASARS